MSWPSQVRHVLSKDLRGQSLLIGLYLVVLVAGALFVGRMRDPIDPPEGMALLASYLLEVLAFLAVASVVQADAPNRPNAFWRSRPFAPTAMLAAKFAFAVVALIAPRLLAQTIGLFAYGVPTASIAEAAAYGVAVLAIVVIAYLLFASLFGDVRGTVLGAIGVLVALALVANLRADQPDYLGRARGALQSALLLLWVSAVVALYRRSDAPRRHRRIGAAAMVGLLLTLRVVTESTGTLATSPTTAPADLPRATVLLDSTVHHMTVDGVPERNIAVMLWNLPADHELQLEHGRVYFELVDGSAIGADVASARLASGRALPSLPGIEWRLQSRWMPTSLQTLNVSLPPRAIPRLDAGVRAIRLEGRISVLEAYADTIVPLGAGSWETRSRSRLTISDVQREADSLILNIHSLRVTIDDAETAEPEADWSGRPDFALVNFRRGEGFPLQFREGTSSNAQVSAPGAVVRTRRWRVATPRHERWWPSPPRDSAWFAEARLVRIGWRERGSYPISVTRVLTATPERAGPRP